MTQRDNILRELNELQSSIGVAGHPGYSVPEDYFDGLAGEILKRINAMEATTPKAELENLSPLLAGISRKTPFAVPDGYFNELSKKMGSMPGTENTSEPVGVSPLLNGLNNKPTYTVPAGYFENLPARINKKIKEGETKVISITSRKWFRYAAAASVIAFVAMLGFVLLGKKEVDPDSKSYAWVEKNLKKVSTDDITEFVELSTLERTDLAKLDTRDDISSLLQDVSDKEIQDFLNETAIADNSNNEELILN